MRYLAAVLLLVACSFAQSNKGDMPPLPAKVLAAKTIYLSVDTDWSQGHTKAAYGELKKWGRFEVVAEPEKADLIFSISNRDAGSANVSFGTGNASGVAVGNTVFATGSSTGVSVPIQLHTYYLRVVDREKGTVLFTASSDERMAKSAEAKRLIHALQKRIEQQERAEAK